jgi:outer membrane autotransporter protein
MDATFSTLGLRGEVGLGGKLRLTGSAGWRHAFGELSDRLPFTTHAFAGADDFTVAGMPIARNAVALDLGVGVALSDRANLSVNYNGQFGSALSDQGVKANLSIRF